MSENTGRVIYTRLVKVTNDADEHPLDVNNHKVLPEMGNTQQVKINSQGEEGYFPPYEDFDLCPVTAAGFFVSINASFDKIDAMSYNIYLSASSSWIPEASDIRIDLVLSPSTSSGNDSNITTTLVIEAGTPTVHEDILVVENNGYGAFNGLTMVSYDVTPSDMFGEPIDVYFSF